jgi:hypothetical protein
VRPLRQSGFQSRSGLSFGPCSFVLFVCIHSQNGRPCSTKLPHIKQDISGKVETRCWFCKSSKNHMCYASNLCLIKRSFANLPDASSLSRKSTSGVLKYHPSDSLIFLPGYIFRFQAVSRLLLASTTHSSTRQVAAQFCLAISHGCLLLNKEKS